MIEEPLSRDKVRFGRLETVALLLLVVAIPLLAVAKLRDDALRLMVVAALFALASLAHGLARRRGELGRRAAVLFFCLLVLYLAGQLALQGKNWLDLAPQFLREAFGL
ncbi:MAG: hypothetical protein U0793_11595 [Gemmataceae bacterium]|mgnify:CR=1 FL=1